MANNFDPHVVVSDADVEIGLKFRLTSILEINDIDGNPIVMYRIRDNNAAASSGEFTVGDDVVDALSWTAVAANKINTVFYKAGLTVQSESISVQVRDYDSFTDTYRWSTVDSAVIRTEKSNSRPPVIEVTDGNVLETEVRGVDNLISYSDPDGVDAVGYWLVDRSVNARGGRFALDGQFKQAGKWFYVPANRLGDVVYHGAKTGNSEMIGVQATDGANRSNVANLTMTTDPNDYRPTMTLQDRDAPVGRVIGVESLITWDDLDPTQTMKQISVYESGDNADGGFLSFNGTRLTPRQFHSVKFDQISQLKYHFADRFDSEVLLARVYDGRHLSALGRGVMRSVTTPDVTNDDTTIQLDELDEVLVTDLMTKNDLGPAYDQIQVVDEIGPNDHGSGHLRLNGSQLPIDSVHTVLASDFGGLTFKTASNIHGRQQDSILYRFSNGTRFSQWQRLEITTDPVGARSLNSNSRWNFWIGQPKTNLTYSFIEHLPSYYDPTIDPEADQTTPLAASQRQMFRDIFDIYEDFSDLTFEEVPFQAGGGNAVIMIGAANLTDGAQAWAYLPGGSGLGSKPGDIWFHIEGPTNPAAPDNSLGGEGYLTALHEIGHALGFKHPFDPGPILPTSVESQFFTVMSYTRPSQHPTDDYRYYPENPSSLALYDIVEIQRLYRVNEEYSQGNTHHFFPESHLLSVHDSSGIDTLNFTTHVQPETINLRQGYYSSLHGTDSSLLVSYGTEIENVRGGSGSDIINGNELRNLIWGNNGDDVITGLGGNDRLMGGVGSDRYVWTLGDGNDVIMEEKKGGRDSLDIHSPYAIDRIDNDLSFSRLGNDLRINLTFNRGRGQGSILVKDMAFGGSRVETLRLFNSGTQVQEDIDLNSIFLQADDQTKLFELTSQQTQFGYVATPV